MKKKIYLLWSLLLILVACRTKNTTRTNGTTSAFFAYYNTLFNAKDALQTELKNRTRAKQDNFHAPYIRLLKYEDQVKGVGDSEISTDLEMATPNRKGGAASASSGASILQIAEAKALKTISKYSVVKDGVERNKTIFDAYILLAQSRIYQERPLEALDALNGIFTTMPKDKRLPLARIYQALAYTYLQDYYKAHEIFLDLKKQNIKKKYKKLLAIYHSEMLLAAHRKEEAVEELEEAFDLNKNKVLRSRITFLRGQILLNLNRKQEAKESFLTAYRYANDFEFEVKSQVGIAKSFDSVSDDYDSVEAYLKKISKKGTYGSRKNEFLYALGLVAKTSGRSEDAINYFVKSKDEKVSDPQVRGLAYYEIGKYYMAKKDYITAGAYYDSALAVMSYQPQKEELEALSRNIKNISKNYYLIKKNDSILRLTQMDSEARMNFFKQHIEKLKEKEAKLAREEQEKLKFQQAKDFQGGDYNTPPHQSSGRNGRGFQNFSSASSRSGFYFANQNAIARGQSEFKQTWGNRSLVDNWRYSNRMNTIEDVKNQALGLDEIQNPRRFEPEYYIEKIPTDTQEILALKKARDTASLGLGRMYDTYFSDKVLATSTLYDLVDAKPEEDVRLQALYMIFSMNFELAPAVADRAKNIILSDYPYTSYAEFVKNPKSTRFSVSSLEVEQLYMEAYNLYAQEKHAESLALISGVMQKFPNDLLTPKFALLTAFNTGKIVGKEVMILQLEQIALNYPKTQEGAKARDILKYLKSDINLEMTDEKGNRIKNIDKKEIPFSKEEISEPLIINETDFEVVEEVQALPSKLKPQKSETIKPQK